MLFPSNIFLFCFLPVVLVLYYGGCHVLLKNNINAKNILLLIASLIFYAYGEGWNLFLLILSIVMNYVFGILMDSRKKTTPENDAKETVLNRRRVILILAVIGNLGLLFVYKYLDFFIANCNRFFHTQIPLTKLGLPIGISFFTFQALSYVADVYRGAAKVQKSPVKLGLYISLFPQLIAGPIVRYDAIEKQMDERRESYPLFSEGVARFIVGLGKKILLADTMALFANRIMTKMAGGTNVSVAMAWFCVAAYTLQIYYDFSGYSDMAIGLGKMFGFSFMENFNYPYIARSVSDFWRRWHISIATWFRDYVYIPLGGSRNHASNHSGQRLSQEEALNPKRKISKTGIFRNWKTYRNIFIVWLLTGLWHGAGWTYITWGMLYFVVLVFERVTGLGSRWELPKALAHIYTMFVVMLGMAVFMSPSMSIAAQYIKNMFGIGAAGLCDATTLFYLKDNWIFLTLSVLFVTPAGKKLEKISWLYQLLLGFVFLLVIIYIIKGNYSPFIYFSF